MSWLSTAGKDIKGIFSWLGSSKGQQVIATGEAVAEAVGAPAAIINIANYWIGKVLTIEAVATAAGQQVGSGVIKAAAVLTDVTPQVLTIAKANGLPVPTSDNLAKANTALVAFLNALGATSTDAGGTLVGGQATNITSVLKPA